MIVGYLDMCNELDVNKLNRTNEYTFSEALNELLDKSNIIITSKKTGDSYVIYKLKEKIKLKFYNTVIKGWQICSYLAPDEIFDKWYVTHVN